MTRERICIIGAGAAGLVAISKLLQAKKFEIQCFEQSRKLGGVWNYEQSDQDFNIVNVGYYDSTVNPIYPNLRTNLPAKLMSFRDYEWTNDDGSPVSDDYFPPHQKVLQYLQDYALKKKLEPYIQFNSTVLAVSKASSTNVWKVSVLDNESGNTTDHYFDSVFLANGHFADPSIPAIPGIDHFPGIATHSISYESADTYSGKRVLVVGSSYSGQDITRELSFVANHVFLSCTNPNTVQLQQATIKEVVTILPEIHKFNSDGSIVMVDGTLIQVSHVIFATGYNYSFPFILKPSHPDQSPEVTDGKQVFDLYLHLYYRNDPSLVFIGLPRQVVPFHLMEYQVEHVVANRLNEFSLPSIEEMKEIEALGGIGGLPVQQTLPSNRHAFGMEREFIYCDALANEFDGLKVPEWRKELRRRTPELRIRALGY